jgi:hypothetical protein
MPDKKIPMCGKCASKVMEQVDNNSQKLVGCLESNSIFNYEDAKVLCPLLRDPNKVLIIINQGVAQLIYKPDNVEVEIRDYDVEGDWDEENIGCKVDHEDCRYQEMIFPVEDIDLGSENEKVEEDEPIKYVNYYRCPDCNEEWQDEWSCACDDECPTCSISYSPYKSLDINKQFIGWQPTPSHFPMAGLHTFEIYEDLEMGKDCHPEVQKWIEIFEGMIEKPVIIPSDKE